LFRSDWYAAGMLAVQLVYFALGMVLLYVGAEWVVRGSSTIARGFDVRPALVGLTIVALGTSAPELMVSTLAALRNAEGIALGNIIGSVVANIGLVLGLSALIRPLQVERLLIRREVPVGVATAILFFVLSLDGRLGRMDGIILLACMVAFIIGGTYMALRDRQGVEASPFAGRLWPSALLLIVGLALLPAGGHLLVKSAIFVAHHFGISEIFIGLTMVAIGTSLPELATSVVASARGENDICVGTVVGSNIFNILLIIGLVALIHPLPVGASLLRCEFVFLLVFSLLLLPILRTGFVISRWEGGAMLLGYAAFVYLAYIT
jgi:cation:H+ antiporter